MALQTLPGSVEEPVSLDEAKLSARVDGPEFDQLIPGLITAARQVAEQECGRKFAAQTVRATLTDWPAAGDLFPIYPAQAIALSYRDGGDWIGLAADQVQLVEAGFAVGVVPAAGVTWPTIPAASGARVRVDILAGDAAPDDVAESVKLYIKAQVAYWLRNPDAATEKAMTASPFLSALLDPSRTWL